MEPIQDRSAGTPKSINHGMYFSEEYLLRVLQVSRSQLRAWQRAGWITPATDGPASSPQHSVNESDARRPARYAHADMLTLKTLLRLRKGGVPARKLRLIHDALRQRFDALGIHRPFSELHLTGQDRRVLLTFRGARMEPLTGQLLLEYSSAPASPLVMAPKTSARGDGKRASASQAERSRRAERLFAAGLRYEHTPGGLSKAMRAYRAALELNPRAIGALLNLGTLYYNQREMGEAARYYSAALQVNPRSALAHFNMGNVADEVGQPLAAIEHYEKAIALDPSYPDPRYNLALVYEKMGRHGQAWKNWRAYVKLDPESKWAATARDKLARHRWQLLRSAPAATSNGD